MKRVRLTEKFAAESSASAEKKKKDKGVEERNTSGFEYDKSKAKVLKKSLHNLNVALGSLIGAMKDLSLLRGSEVTPDGKLGGRGFIMNFRDIKSLCNEAINNLSDITDTIADELTNPKWGLNPSEVKKVKKVKEEVNEKADEAEEIVEDIPDKVPVPEEKESGKGTDDISPEDVVDSSDTEAIKRYQSLIEGKSKDRVANMLSKNIMANLLKGE